MWAPLGLLSLFLTSLGSMNLWIILQGSFSGPGVSKGRGCSWGTLRIPFGKISIIGLAGTNGGR